MIKFYTFHLFKKTVQHSSFLWIVVNDEHDISIIWAPKNSFHWYFPFEFFRSNDQSCKNSTSNPPPPKLPKKQEIPIKDKLTWPTKKTLFKTNQNPPLESETNSLFFERPRYMAFHHNASRNCEGPETPENEEGKPRVFHFPSEVSFPSPTFVCLHRFSNSILTKTRSK